MKDNKLIAEFMGYDISTIVSNGVEVVEFEDADVRVEDLKYHTSWNWLMPVVDKIEDEGYGFERNKQEDGDWQCLIVKGYDIIHQTFADCSREATYKAVVEFIKEYTKES